MPDFNLIRDPWIPVLLNDGSSQTVHLCDVFLRGSQIRDLPVKPHERISLLRLLICIAQATAKGPRHDDDKDEWDSLFEQLPMNAPEYLYNHEESFNLFGSGPRFLQHRFSGMGEQSCGKLILHLAAGANPTVFDHEADTLRSWSPPELALGLLTFQNFSGALGSGHKGMGLCVDELQVFRTGANLLETIVMNMASVESVERRGMKFWEPVWHHALASGDRLDGRYQDEATRSYLGRLVPVLRALWLNENGQTVEIGNGPPFPGIDEGLVEPSATECINKNGKRFVLPCRLHRAVWRDLSAITAIRVGGSSMARGALTLERQDYEQSCKLWAGTMVLHHRLKGKIEDVVESRFDGELAVPGTMFSANPEANNTYFAGVQAAEAWESATKGAVGKYAACLKFSADGKRKIGLQNTASSVFWSRIEHHLPKLFALAREPSLLAGTPAQDPYAKTDWHRALREMAHEAFNAVCPQDTGRQHEAAGFGLSVLTAKRLDSKTKPKSKGAPKKAKS